MQKTNFITQLILEIKLTHYLLSQQITNTYNNHLKWPCIFFYGYLVSKKIYRLKNPAF